jgi:hypothetical protein
LSVLLDTFWYGKGIEKVNERNQGEEDGGEDTRRIRL